MLNEELLLALALPLLVVVTQATMSVSRRLNSFAKARCIARIVRMIMAKEEPSDDEMRLLRLRFGVRIILEATIFISEHIYGNALCRLALLIEVCEIDRYILHKVQHSRGGGDSLLAKLPYLTHASTAVECAELYPHREQYFACFQVAVALIVAHPERAIYYVSQLENRLTWCEVALLTQLMRRVGQPIAYTPLLTSQNRNLQLLGIYICSHFSAVDAEPHLQLLVESEDSEVSYMALLALCSIRGGLATTQVGNLLARLDTHHRSAFIRHAVLASHSPLSCANHLTRKEQMVFKQQIDSYKCRIVCN